MHPYVHTVFRWMRNAVTAKFHSWTEQKRKPTSVSHTSICIEKKRKNCRLNIKFNISHRWEFIRSYPPYGGTTLDIFSQKFAGQEPLLCSSNRLLFNWTGKFLLEKSVRPILTSPWNMERFSRTNTLGIIYSLRWNRIKKCRTSKTKATMLLNLWKFWLANSMKHVQTNRAFCPTFSNDYQMVHH